MLMLILSGQFRFILWERKAISLNLFTERDGFRQNASSASQRRQSKSFLAFMADSALISPEALYTAKSQELKTHIKWHQGDRFQDVKKQDVTIILQPDPNPYKSHNPREIQPSLSLQILH